MSSPRAAILRARRKRAARGDDEHAIHTRRRWRVEGAHGTAKTLHGLARAIRGGLENTKIQALLTAIAMNLEKPAATLLPLLWPILEICAARPNPAAARNDFFNGPRWTDSSPGRFGMALRQTTGFVEPLA